MQVFKTITINHMSVTVFGHLRITIYTTNLGCDRQQLSDGTTLTSDATNTCGSPLHSVGIKNGIACFASINPGATAFYMCAHPDSGVIKRSARTCLHNGTWNGTIPLCEGDTTIRYYYSCSYTSVCYHEEIKTMVILF